MTVGRGYLAAGERIRAAGQKLKAWTTCQDAMSADPELSFGPDCMFCAPTPMIWSNGPKIISKILDTRRHAVVKACDLGSFIKAPIKLYYSRLHLELPGSRQ